MIRLAAIVYAAAILSVQGSLGEWFDATEYEHGNEWMAWKGSHNKTYLSYNEEWGRFNIWLNNKQYIDRHNQEQRHTYTLRMNHFGDMVYVYIIFTAMVCMLITFLLL